MHRFACDLLVISPYNDFLRFLFLSILYIYIYIYINVTVLYSRILTSMNLLGTLSSEISQLSELQTLW